MEGPIALDGGRSLKSYWFAAAGLLCSSAAFAKQASDPLAPLVPGQVAPAPANGQSPVVIPQAPVISVPTVPVPRDWRGVFDAIDNGNWASAAAGIATLPPNI